MHAHERQDEVNDPFPPTICPHGIPAPMNGPYAMPCSCDPQQVADEFLEPLRKMPMLALMALLLSSVDMDEVNAAFNEEQP